MTSATAFRPIGVLIVHDDAEVRRHLGAGAAQVPRARVHEAESHEAALAVCARSPIDVAVVPRDLPAPGWRWLAERIRGAGAPESVAIVLTVTDLDVVALDEALESTVDDVLFEDVPDTAVGVRIWLAVRRMSALRGLTGRLAWSQQLTARQSHFLSTVSHEIRTPLSAMMSAANILWRYGREKPESVERFSRVIYEEGQRLTRLINNLLDLAKIEADEVEWSFEPTAIETLVTRVVEALAPFARERGTTLSTAVDAGLEAVVLDADRVTQVLVNLVSNAVKHSPDGGTVHLRGQARPDGGVRIEVEDEGEGVPVGMEEQIFERFQQITGEDRRSGTGLGLAISKEIVDRHGGTIRVEPNRGPGALFVVELPGPQGRP